MSKELLFVQCELKRRHEDLDAYIIIWIPEKYFSQGGLVWN